MNEYNNNLVNFIFYFIYFYKIELKLFLILLEIKMSYHNILNLNHKINEAFTGTFDSEKININFIPNTFYSENCNLTRREIIILKSVAIIPKLKIL